MNFEECIKSAMLSLGEDEKDVEKVMKRIEKEINRITKIHVENKVEDDAFLYLCALSTLQAFYSLSSIDPAFAEKMKEAGTCTLLVATSILRNEIQKQKLN